MKLIIVIDPKLASLLDSVRLHPNRIFFCKSCNLNCTRTEVSKDREGVYHCLHCEKPVEDITDTDQGRYVATIMGL
jgi:hypothetical protein